jgi:hypothetical protein
MSAFKRIFAVSALAVLFASGTAFAAPHPQSPGAGTNEHKTLEEAAKRVQLDGIPSPKALTGII